jgi:class 3 adenylate cyclase/pimeloyl-ACP methyl ester carboxylesterase
MLTAPNIEFAQREGVHLAYQTAGQGDLDLVYVAGAWASTLAWDVPSYAKELRRMASFSRLVTYDQRGIGYSDPIDQSTVPSIDDLVADLAAVIAAAGVTNPILFGSHNGGAVAAAYAVNHRVSKLILCNTWARLSVAEDYPIGFSEEVLDRLAERYRTQWGDGKISSRYATPRADMPQRSLELASTSRSQSITLFEMNRSYDIRPILPSVDVPTLVLHLEDNRSVPAHFGRYVAESIPGARLVLIPGTDQVFLRNYGGPVIDQVELFATGTLTAFMDTVTTTMLFTDIVDSTARAATVGDEAWAKLIDAHNDQVRQHALSYGGDEMKCTGDGFLVAFDDPASAVRCALAVIDSVADLGLEVRAGVHVGEVTRMGRSDVSGLAVHFAQRLCSMAGDGQVLTSAAAMEQCEGSEISFAPQGSASFKGIPGEWPIFDAMVITP